MELTKLALIKTVMPCVKLEIAEQALQNESNPREQRSEEHTSELQSRFDLVFRLLLEKKKYKQIKL
mgnify:CR=1 FL=1